MKAISSAKEWPKALTFRYMLTGVKFTPNGERKNERFTLVYVIYFCWSGSIAISLVLNCLESHQCSNYERMTGKQTKWLTLDACYVQTDAGWQRWDEYKIRNIASEGLQAPNEKH